MPARVLDAVFAYAAAEAPLECCGLLAGVDGVVRRHYPLANEAQSPTEFLACVGLLGPFKEMRARGERLLAIYHSHPSTPAIPSRRDRERNLYPNVAHLIVSLEGSTPSARLWRIDDAGVVELDWKTIVDVDPLPSRA